MFICYLLGNIYLFISTIKAIAQAPIAVKVIYGIIFWSLSVSLFLSIALRNSHLPQALLSAMYTFGSIWLVFVLYMILSIILFSIIRYFFPSIIYNTLLYSLIVTFTLLAYGYINYLTPVVTTIEIKTEKAIEGDSVTITTGATNTSGVDGSLINIIAVYDSSDRLLAVKEFDAIDYANGDFKTQTYNVTVTEEGATKVRVFTLNDDGTITFSINNKDYKE